MANTDAAITWSQWLVQTNSVSELWAAQPTYMIAQSVFLLAGLVTFLHAYSKGGRWPYFWVGTLLHGFFTDNFWHFVLPEYDNFWHSQTPVMLLGARLPLHIILLYPAFIYHAAYAVSRLNLPKYAEPFAVGLLTVLIDIPYDIVSVKFVHWTWHDTDPNIYDRHYWVPWNSYYFHATFAASFYFIFHASRKMISGNNQAQWKSLNTKTELISLAFASLLGMPGGVLQFIPLYHPLHDSLSIHTEVCFFVLFSIYAGIVLRGLVERRPSTVEGLTKIDYVIILQLILHYSIYWIFVVFYNPQDERSLGLHEPIGPCNELSYLITPFGQKLSKRKYLCIKDYDEKYFNFHCTDKAPSNGASWYLICGTPFENRAEYITVISAILLLAFGVFSQAYKTQSKDSKKKR